MIRHFCAVPSVVLLLGAHLAGTAHAAELVSTHADWKAFRHGEGRELTCFAATPAKERQPSDGDRAAPYAYVTTWPAQGVKGEVSIVLGFAVRKETQVSVDIGGTTYNLTPDGDRGFVGDPAEEQKLLEAMQRGSRMTVEAVQANGSRSRDVYSLTGSRAAVQAIAGNCS